MKRFIILGVLLACLCLSGCGNTHDTFSVTFEVNGGSFIEDITVEKGMITPPTDPYLKGYLLKAGTKI